MAEWAQPGSRCYSVPAYAVAGVGGRGRQLPQGSVFLPGGMVWDCFICKFFLFSYTFFN